MLAGFILVCTYLGLMRQMNGKMINRERAMEIIARLEIRFS
jgi:hypothetical protein